MFSTCWFRFRLFSNPIIKLLNHTSIPWKSTAPQGGRQFHFLGNSYLAPPPLELFLRAHPTTDSRLGPFYIAASWVLIPDVYLDSWVKNVLFLFWFYSEPIKVVFMFRFYGIFFHYFKVIEKENVRKFYLRWKLKPEQSNVESVDCRSSSVAIATTFCCRQNQIKKCLLQTNVYGNLSQKRNQNEDLLLAHL